ncbi:MAG: glycosyltransferase [Ignavibacteriaceae bacterium]|nr:glycosyltransferase [Ignavibacteriaceae bacterium]
MKILWFSNTCANASDYLNDNFVRGGWLQSLDKLLQDKVELHVAFYYHKLDSSFKYGNTTYHPINPLNWKSQRILNHLLNRVVDQEDLKYYLDIIDRVKPDLIHIHGTENSFHCLINKVNIPVVVSIQGIITACLNKFTSGIELNYLSLYSFNLKGGLKSLFFASSFKTERKLSVQRSMYELRDLKNCRYMIGRTDWDRRVTSILAPGRNYYHNDEMLRDIFYKEKWTLPLNKDKLVILSIAGDSPSKGFETICESIYELKQSGFTNFEWMVAGISESDLIVKIVKKKLKRKYPKSGLLLLGTINESLLIDKFKVAHLFVSASYIENSSNSLCEAMMLGMPCIATCVGGTSSLLRDKTEGILIQEGDPWSMAGAILELFKNTDKAVEYGNNARKRASIRHDKNKIVSDLISIYHSVTNLPY